VTKSASWHQDERKRKNHPMGGFFFTFL